MSSGDRPPIDEWQPSPGFPVARPVHCVPLPVARPVAGYGTTASRGQALIEIILFTLAGAFLLVFLFTIVALVPEKHAVWAALGGQLTHGLALVGLCLLVAARRGESPASLGWTTRRIGPDILIGSLAMFLTMPLLMAVMLGGILLFPELLADRMAGVEAMQETLPSDMNLLTILIASICIAVWEETVFRGFLLTRLQAIYRRWWLSVLLSAALFSIGHSYQGFSAMIMIGLLGLVMGALAAWRKSIIPCLVFHMLFDITQLVLLQLLPDLTG